MRGRPLPLGSPGRRIVIIDQFSWNGDGAARNMKSLELQERRRTGSPWRSGPGPGQASGSRGFEAQEEASNGDHELAWRAQLAWLARLARLRDARQGEASPEGRAS